MRKLLFSFFLAFFLANSMEAQELNFGFKGGVNFSSIQSSNTPIEDLTKSRTSFHLGGFTELKFSKLFALQLEALYSGQGAKIKNTYIEITPPGELGYVWETEPAQASPENSMASGKYNYLNIPLLAKLYVYEGLNIFGGPQLSILLSAEDSQGTAEMDVADLLDPVDFGLTGGLGYQFNMGLFFSASYYWGINNISAINTENLLGFNVDLHQGVFQISTGYRF